MPRPIWARWIDASDHDEIVHLVLHIRELVITRSTEAEFRALSRKLRRDGFDLPWLLLVPADPRLPLPGAERTAVHSLRCRIFRFLDSVFGLGHGGQKSGPAGPEARPVAAAFGCGASPCPLLRSSRKLQSEDVGGAPCRQRPATF